MKAVRSRSWIDFGDTNVIRLVNAEGDGLPALTVDQYGDYLMVQYYTPAWEMHLPTVADALQEVYAPLGVYAKFRTPETRMLASGKKQIPAQGRIEFGDVYVEPAAGDPLGIADHRFDVPQRVVEVERDDFDARHQPLRLARG